jgi:hypothetical protein
MPRNAGDAMNMGLIVKKTTLDQAQPPNTGDG